MLAEATLKQTPLYDQHVALNAKMVPFGGWEMPLQYEGIIAEYDNTRNGVSVFDTSHMGEFFIEGDLHATGLDKIVSQPLADLPLKNCRYGVMLNDHGGVIDDLIVYRLEKERWMIVVNGATTEKDARQFLTHLSSKKVFTDASAQTGKLDIQGPSSRTVLSSLIKGLEKLGYYTFDYFDVLGEQVIVSRTGYTGELGYEIYFPWKKTPQLWAELLKRGVKPAGLGVRDVLRIEMGYSLYGHELEEDISPLDAGLGRFIDWEKDFIGKEALMKEKAHGAARTIACFVSQTRRSPRAGNTIFSPDGKKRGVVTSGTFSPSLQKGIGLGFVAKEHAKVGGKILCGDEKNTIETEIVGRPVYKKGSLKA